MAQHDWKGNNGQGFMRNNEMYCCQGCAEGGRCTCQ
jgi:hypothetical protein